VIVNFPFVIAKPQCFMVSTSVFDALNHRCPWQNSWIFRAQSLWQALFASRRKAYEAQGMKHKAWL
jgi:hypothetical protein